MFTLEEMKDGNYRLTWSDSLVGNFSEIKGFDIIREDKEDFDKMIITLEHD